MRASPSLLQIPDLFELAQTVIRRHRIHFAVTERYRDRSQWAALLPSLSAEAHYATARDMVNIQTYQFASFPFTYYNSALDGGLTWQITAKWDLGRLISSKERIPHWGRIERNHSGLRQEILERVHRLYVEYRRVARQLVYAPPAELVARQFLELRLQEITAYLDALSGGAWSKRIAALNSDR